MEALENAAKQHEPEGEGSIIPYVKPAPFSPSKHGET